MKNSAEKGGCYPPRPKAEVDNTLRDLQNSSHPTKAEFNNCFIIHSKYFPVLKGVSLFRSVGFSSPGSLSVLITSTKTNHKPIAAQDFVHVTLFGSNSV